MQMPQVTIKSISGKNLYMQAFDQASECLYSHYMYKLNKDYFIYLFSIQYYNIQISPADINGIPHLH